MVLDLWVHNKTWLQMMNILSLHSLCEDVHLGADRSSCINLGQLSLDVVCETPELFNVDRFTGSDVLVDVINKCLPDDQILGLWLHGLQVVRCPGCRSVVLSWVF